VLVALTVLCALLAWQAATSLRWMNARHEFIGGALADDEVPKPGGVGSPNQWWIVYGGSAPLALWPFGERGVSSIQFTFEPLDAERLRVQSLFPEATITSTLIY
jgi:hypothetical protein